MKIFHKKFLSQERELSNNPENIAAEDKTKFGYLLNQVLIWGLIFMVLFFIFKFTAINFN
ncbi:hypothetical protein [Flavobacterium sp.]|uniref:hypothetical protein n=1 Tax=Flavobacterium sp. TaxID=239 RepID=UPI002FDB4013